MLKIHGLRTLMIIFIFISISNLGKIHQNRENSRIIFQLEIRKDFRFRTYLYKIRYFNIRFPTNFFTLIKRKVSSFAIHYNIINYVIINLSQQRVRF